MMKNVSTILLLLLVCACRTSTSSLGVTDSSSVIINEEMQDSILPSSYELPAGVVCYLTTADYDYVLPNMNIFKPAKHSGFISMPDVNRTSSSGKASGIIRSDTIIRSNYLSKAVVGKACAGSAVDKKICVINDNLVVPEVIDLQYAIDKYHPNAIIELDTLFFHITGEIQSSSIPYDTDGGQPYAGSSASVVNHTQFGQIDISYYASWNIHLLHEGVVKRVHQKGHQSSKMNLFFNLIEELNKCTAKIGADFAGIFVQK